MGLEEGERVGSLSVGYEEEVRGESLRIGEDGKEDEVEMDGEVETKVLWLQFLCLRVCCCCC